MSVLSRNGLNTIRLSLVQIDTRRSTAISNSFCLRPKEHFTSYIYPCYQSIKDINIPEPLPRWNFFQQPLQFQLNFFLFVYISVFFIPMLMTVLDFNYVVFSYVYEGSYFHLLAKMSYLSFLKKDLKNVYIKSID